MLKACLLTMTVLVSLKANAFLDSIVDTAKDAAEGAAVAGAMTDLLDEVDPDAAPTEENAKVQAENARLQQQVRDARYIDRETRELMNGPDLTSKRLSSNIKFTTQFVQRTKRLLTKIGVLSPEVTTAVNTAQTTTQMNEMLQNQQTMIMQQQQIENERKKKDLANRKSWEDFIATQRAARRPKE